MKKVGIVLGGGGARGLAHLGVLRALQRSKIPVNCIAGTSMGAIVGACYAVNPDIEAIIPAMKDCLASSLFSNMKFTMIRESTRDPGRRTLLTKARDFIKFGIIHYMEHTQYSLLGMRELEEIVSTLLPDIDIKETKVPFCCVATDLTNGTEKIFTSGSLRKSVMASASIPGVFPPVEIGGTYYSDGGAVNVTPVSGAKLLGADLIIATDVKSRILRWEKPEMAREIVSRCNYITGVLLNEYQLREAHVVIQPSVKHLHWSAFDKIDLLIKEGEKAAAQKLWEIRTKTIYRRFTDRLLRLFRLATGETKN